MNPVFINKTNTENMPIFDYNSYRNLDATKKGLKGPVDCLPELIYVCDGKPAILHTLLENELSKAQIDEVIVVTMVMI